MMRETLFCVGLIGFVAALQIVLVQLGHPHALWLWCSILRFC